MADSLDEAQLAAWMRAACDGDGRAQARLLSGLAPRLRAYFRAKGRPPDQAEDLVQETLIAVHTKRALYDVGQPLLPWVLAIARFRLVDAWRREGRFGSPASLDDAPEEALSAEERAPAEASRDLAKLLRLLPEKQRRSIELVKLEERSVAEAAALSGWSESDVKVSAHRGLKALMRLAALGHGGTR